MVFVAIKIYQRDIYISASVVLIWGIFLARLSTHRLSHTPRGDFLWGFSPEWHFYEWDSDQRDFSYMIKRFLKYS